MRGLALLLVAGACTGATSVDGSDGSDAPGIDGDVTAEDVDGGAPGPGDAGPMGRGASVPWIEYEAEDGTTSGEVVGPGRQLGTPAGEASGRRAVILDATGEFVAWTTRAAASAVVVRFSLPDAPAGGGIDSTLGLYVDGQRRADLALSSRQAWVYGDDVQQFDSPSAGPPRRIYAETRLRLGFTIAAGAEVKLQKDAEDDAPHVAIDFVDLELAGEPLGRPDGFIDVTQASPPAVPDDGQPDDVAIHQALARAMAGEAPGVYFPPGTFDHEHKLPVKGIVVAGAGIWYTTLANHSLAEDPGWGETGFVVTGDGATFRDFALFGNTDGLRNQGGKAWANSAFRGTTIENVWVENVQCGYWVGGTEESTNLTIRNSRIRNTGADAINLCNGTRDSLVENVHARHTGDDAFAIWSARDLYPHPDENNVIRRCTAQLPWRAAGFAIYGGSGNRIEDSAVYDTLTYPGLTVSSQYDPYPLVSATVDGLTLVRAGGRYWGDQELGAVWIYAEQDPTGGVTIRNVDIVDPTYSGIHVQGAGGLLTGTRIEDVTIHRPPTYGVWIQAGAVGSASFANVSVIEPGTAALANQSQAQFTVEDGGGNSW